MHPPSSVCEFALEANNWAMVRSRQAQALWAKSGDGTGSLSLPQHLVDSACAAALVYDVWLPFRMKSWLASQLGLETHQGVRKIYLWLAGVHDIGKATLTFQSQSYKSEFEYLFSAVRDSGLSGEMNSVEKGLGKFPHGVASGLILQKWLRARGFDTGFFQVVDAHHGVASTGSGNDEERALARYKTEWKAVHNELIDAMADLTGVESALECANADNVAALQVLTGLVVMADWVASNQDAFPMIVEGSQEKRLRQAVELTDFTGPLGSYSGSFDPNSLYQHLFGFEPREVQRQFFAVAAGIDEPGLLVLEAETGVGKTEAALAAAGALGHDAQGIYFAAPTMATANGLLERVLKWADKVNGGDSVSSMYLAHSKNQLVESYRRLRYYGVGRDHGERGNVVASSWMNGRHRGLLSNVVVGTIDQVLMMALKQRYSMLRHVALAGKVVIFDEVHAYDAYTSDYLNRTIRWLSYYGASVIVMTAILPPERRAALISAYTEAPIPKPPEGAYPLVTVATQSTVRFEPIAPEPTNLSAEVRVCGDELSELGTEVNGLVGGGGCALIICNTIARAQQAYRHLDAMYPGEVELHHAGFMAWQRVEREEKLLKELGPKARRHPDQEGSEGVRPHRRIVVATQVAEQSLDIDADVLITDIAPIDLLIQRIGRLHRHQRPSEDRPSNLWEPQVLIRGTLRSDPVPEFDSGALAVYGQKLLLATMANLPRVFKRPADIPSLVRTVYSDAPGIPGEWREAWEVASTEEERRKSRAHQRAGTYMVHEPEDLDSYADIFNVPAEALAELDRDEVGNAQVRDAEPSLEVIPISVRDNGYSTYGADFGFLQDEDEPSFVVARHLASSTVRLPARMTRFDSDFETVVGGLEELTPLGWARSNFLKGQLALPLDEEGEVHIGRFALKYSRELGIELLSDGRRKYVSPNS